MYMMKYKITWDVDSVDHIMNNNKFTGLIINYFT